MWEEFDPLIDYMMKFNEPEGPRWWSKLFWDALLIVGLVILGLLLLGIVTSL